MVDVKKHSDGYWRSIMIYAPEEWDDNSVPQTQMRAKNILKDKLEEMELYYAYNYYSGVEGKEEPHITFRVLFNTAKEITEIEKFLNKQKWKYENKNYDEEQWVKWAYVFGTTIAEQLIELEQNYRDADVYVGEGFLRLMLHGMFNCIGTNYKQETEVYMFFLNSMLNTVYGLKPKELPKAM